MKNKYFDQQPITDKNTLITPIDVDAKSLIDLTLKKTRWSQNEIYQHYNIHSKIPMLIQAISSWSDKVYNGTLEPKSDTVDIDLIDIDETEQRELCIVWACHILHNHNFDYKQLAPIFCTFDKETGRYLAFEGQHTLFVIYQLIKMGKRKSKNVNIIYIETNDPMVRRELTEAINGEGKMGWVLYDHYRNAVYAAHYNNSTIEKHKNLLIKHKYLLDNGIYVMDEKLHKGYFPRNYKDRQGVLHCIDQLMDAPLERFYKIIDFHTKYFKGNMVRSSLFHLFEQFEITSKLYNITISDEMIDDMGRMLSNKYGDIELYLETLKDGIVKWCKNNGVPARSRKRYDTTIMPLVMYKQYGGTEYVPVELIHAYGDLNGGGTLMDAMGITQYTPTPQLVTA
jgi:hypothetical protein